MKIIGKFAKVVGHLVGLVSAGCGLDDLRIARQLLQQVSLTGFRQQAVVSRGEICIDIFLCQLSKNAADTRVGVLYVVNRVITGL